MKKLERKLLHLLFVLTVALLCGLAALLKPLDLPGTAGPSLSIPSIPPTEAAQTEVPPTAPAEALVESLALSFDLADLPAYEGELAVPVNGNVPYFAPADLTAEPFETYSELDSLGRCGPAYACLCRELMPTEPRGAVGQIKPTGWHTVRYDDLIRDKYLYNRCHLIAYQLAGENSNEKNLITGTRYLNVSGMLPFENKVAGHLEKTGGHVLYRVTPAFFGDEQVARGVLMEAMSVEDGGAGLCFCVYVHNVQPGIVIDYATGDSTRAEP